MPNNNQHFAKYEHSQFHVTKDGHTMTVFDIAKELNRKSFLEAESEQLDKAKKLLKQIMGNYQVAASVAESEGYETNYEQDKILFDFFVSETTTN